MLKCDPRSRVVAMVLVDATLADIATHARY